MHDQPPDSDPGPAGNHSAQIARPHALLLEASLTTWTVTENQSVVSADDFGESDHCHRIWSLVEYVCSGHVPAPWSYMMG
jgi:hypothetical protein